MASDQNTPNSIKSLLITTFAAVFFTVAVVLMYLLVRQEAYGKAQPYSIEIQLQANQSSQIVVYYDYGYGYEDNLGHHQRFDLLNDQNQTISFTISAWKTLYGLRVVSDASVDINRLTIQKSNITLEALESTRKVTKELPLSLIGLDQELIGASQ